MSGTQATTIEQFAKVIKITPERLLVIMKTAGILVQATSDYITDSQKKSLLLFLKSNRSVVKTAPEESQKPEEVVIKTPPPTSERTLSLKRNRTPNASSRSKTVNIEVRGKRRAIKSLAVTKELEVAPEEPTLDVVDVQAVTHENTKVQEVVSTQTTSADEAVLKTEPETLDTPENLAEQAKESAPKTDNEKVKFEKKFVKKTKVKRPEKDFSKISRKKVRGSRPGRSGSQANPNNSHGFAKPTQTIVHEVTISESITVAELAQKMSVKAAEVIKAMMGMGGMVTINQSIDQETAMLLVEEMGHTPVSVSDHDIETDLLSSSTSSPTSFEAAAKAPVVTIMGHVDHGKTSLLDYIRRTKVTSTESGGITQHIAAYQVETSKGQITFLDTPGHAAFSEMRARGAQCTDLIILVVAADDGVMPQTIEAIQHAKAAKVPIIVAVNKIDKPDADQERVKSELSQHDIICESWGGDVIFQPVSALTGVGVTDLLESISLQAEFLELKAVNKGPAKGVVIEARLEKGRGSVATVLITEGEIKTGQAVVAGREFGRVRAMINDRGQATKNVGPSVPIELLGLSGVPQSGDELLVVADERKAREIALFRQSKFRQVRLARQQTAKLEGLFERMGSNPSVQAQSLNIVLKAGVQGSVEAIRTSLSKLSTDEVKVNIVSGAVGGINESDVNLALASNAIIIGFNVRANATARRLIEHENIDLHYFSIIYNLIDNVKAALSGLLKPEIQENIIGLAQVREVFRSSKLGAVAGCMVIDGTMKRSLPIRVLRQDIVIYEGELESLRRFKDEAQEVRNGMECGIGVKNYNDVKAGDQIEVFERISIARSL